MHRVHAASVVLPVLALSPIPALGQAPPAEQPVLREIVADISADRIEADIRTLVDFGTRHTLSDTVSETRGIGAARRWIKSEFERISAACGGCLEVMYTSSMVSGERRIPDSTLVVNVIAIQRGTTDPHRYVMMSGDIDSRVSDSGAGGGVSLTDAEPLSSPRQHEPETSGPAPS